MGRGEDGASEERKEHKVSRSEKGAGCGEAAYSGEGGLGEEVVPVEYGSCRSS